MQQNVFPVEYGPDFDTALETLICVLHQTGRAAAHTRL